MKVVTLIVKYLKLLIHPVQKFNKWLRILSLQIQAHWQGGEICVGNKIQVHQKVIFQGKGKVHLDDGVALGYAIGGSPTLPILLQPRNQNSIIEIGKNSALVNGTEIIACEKVVIGKNCRIGARCTIIDSDFHGISPDSRSTSGLVYPVIIGNNVWIGLSVLILKGVNVGNDAIIGAGCVVTKNISDGDIVVGNPMRVIGNVFDIKYEKH